jgi:hypothetical protein
MDISIPDFWELQIKFQIFFFIKEIGGGMASKYFLEER